MAKYGSGDGRWFVQPTTLPTLNFHQFKPHIRFSAAHQYSNYGSSIHHIEMTTHSPDTNRSESMGTMQWHRDRGEILAIHVNKPYRRMGVANTLLQEAKDIAKKHNLTAPVHSEDRSDMGDAWAQSTGDTLPKRMTRRTRSRRIGGSGLGV